MLSSVDAVQVSSARLERWLTRLRRTVVQVALSGDLVEQHPDDEPADLLLKRIAAEREDRSAKTRKTRARRARKTEETTA